MLLRFLALFLCLSFSAVAQQTKRDSLDKLLLHAPADTNRVVILNTAAFLYFSSNPKKVLHYAEEAMRLSRSLGYERGIGRSYLSYSAYYLSQGQYRQAIDTLNKALPHFDRIQDTDGIAKTYMNIGLNLKNLGDFSQATDYYFKSLKTIEKTGNRASLANIYNSVGVLFKDQEKYDQALSYYWQAFRNAAGVDMRGQAGTLLNIGQVYQLRKDYPTAIKYIEQAKTRFTDLKEPLGLVICDNNLANIYFRMGQFDEAEPRAQRALAIGTTLNYVPNMVTSLLILSDIRLQTGQGADSFVFLNKALPLAEQIHQQSGRTSVYKGLAEAHAKTGNFARAYQFQSQWMALKDSTFNESSAKKIAGVQAQYQSEKKQAEIELLQKDQQVARLWRNSLGAGLLAIVLMAGLVMSRQRLKIRKDEVLVAQSKLVSEKNGQLEAQTHLLENQARQLQELDEAKNRFFTNVTHEFRTPLTLLIGTLSEKLYGLADHTETLIQRSEVTVMHRNAHRLLQLINQLLDLSKIDSGRLDLVRSADDVKPMLTTAVAMFTSLADQRQIKLTVHVPEQPLPVSHDGEQLKTVVTNLLANAFKFTPDGGDISLTAGAIQLDDKPFVRLIIDDNGVGITPDQAERVFERFYQGAASPNRLHTDRQPGTGVGLALVKEIVRLHNGTIRIENKSGPGARFVVLLPGESTPTGGRPGESTPGQAAAVVDSTTVAKLASSHSVTPDPSPQTNGPDSRPLLLIVEDNDDVRTFIHNQMQAHYRVLEAGNGLLGLKVAQGHLPDLIISDWMMPDMNGIDLCHQIKADERTSHIPFMLLTALSAQDQRLTGLETGADDYLTKPFDSRELLLRTQNLIASRRTLHDRFSREIRIQPKDITVTSADEKFLTRVMAIVEEHMGNAEFSAEQFGREVGLSRMQLHRKLVALTGLPSGDFIRIMRLKRAAQLLDQQSGNISEIAYEVGFNSLSYFAKCFRGQFGLQPTEYQNRVRENTSLTA